MTGPQRILHVEDDPDIREIAYLALSVLGGFHVVQCASGPEALDRAATVDPELVLMDVQMPEMDGFQTLEHLRRIDRFQHLPVIFVSAKTNLVAEGPGASAENCLGVIGKPFDAASLAGDIRDCWARAARPELAS